MKKIIVCLLFLLPLKLQALKIAALMPSHAEIICSIGMCGDLIAVGSYCDWPKELESKPKAGDYFKPDLEKLYSLKPDLVFLPVSLNSTAASDLKKIGLKVIEIEPEKNIGDICFTAKKIASYAGRDREAEKFCLKLNLEISKFKPKKRKKIFYEIDSGFWTAGGESFLSDVLSKAGGRNIFEARKENYFKVSWETVIKENPDIIISNYSKPEYFYSLPLADKVSAVKNKKVFLLEKNHRDILVRPGPRIPRAVKKLSEMIDE
ncbi:MAG: ABC transporter substrate-binding protein [Elusimicrobia bacterium]|nr:ABC transporter substrate-binding protein [Elusimicrobiota bacterium]